MGLGQGSGGSNPGFTLTLAPMIYGFMGMNFQAGMRRAWSGILITLAAIMYVDDMDMLLKALEDQSIEELFAFIQATTDFWGLITMASGGSLKQKKCQVAIVSFNFSGGRSRIQQLRSLPKYQFVIPQKDNTTTSIPTISAEADVTTL